MKIYDRSNNEKVCSKEGWEIRRKVFVVQAQKKWGKIQLLPQYFLWSLFLRHFLLNKVGNSIFCISLKNRSSFLLSIPKGVQIGNVNGTIEWTMLLLEVMKVRWKNSNTESIQTIALDRMVVWKEPFQVPAC